ncbi:MAG: hypothetical protein QME62_10990, partial [Armatimonadota bacterium]|nr:hypothetical protein [Armatimonadota bacterium]
MIKAVLPLLGICLLGSNSHSYEVSNGYFLLSGRDGYFDVLRLDPLGKGKYGKNIIKSLAISDLGESFENVGVERSANSIIFKGITIKLPFKVKQEQSGYPVECASGGTLGVKFTVDSGKITRVTGSFPTWHETNCGCTLALYRLPEGNFEKKELVARRVIENVPDNSRQGLEFSPQLPGTYYFEMSEPTGKRIGWWGTNKDANPL